MSSFISRDSKAASILKPYPRQEVGVTAYVDIACLKVTPLPPLDHLRIVEAATHQWLERERARLARSQAECLRLEQELKLCRDEIAALSKDQ